MQSELKMKQEINELLQMRVKVDMYRGQRDEAMLALKNVRSDTDAKDQELQALRQQLKQITTTSISEFQQQQVQLLRQQRDEVLASHQALKKAFEEQAVELQRLKAKLIS
eukprot:c1368_g1_i2.p2 GENE.c1368_g1_i2~~c1368_g1_i2.p2  ORF type:complete len:110 (+),score=39.48 c1368_g1_i2:276-605(+)